MTARERLPFGASGWWREHVFQPHLAQERYLLFMVNRVDCFGTFALPVNT
jgi:hypothetical protein